MDCSQLGQVCEYKRFAQYYHVLQPGSDPDIYPYLGLNGKIFSCYNNIQNARGKQQKAEGGEGLASYMRHALPQ